MGIQVEVTSDSDKATKGLVALEDALRRIKSLSAGISVKPMMSTNDIKNTEKSVNGIAASTRQASSAMAQFQQNSVRLNAPLENINSRYVNINKATNASVVQQNMLSKAVMNTADSTARLEKGVAASTESFKSLAVATASFAAIGATVFAGTGMLDGITTFNNKIKLATNGTLEFHYAMRQVQAISVDTRTGLTEVADLYARISRATNTFQRSQAQVASVTKTVSESIAMSGASAEAASAAVMQLGQALGSGVLQGDELRSILENAPALADAIAAGLGKSIGELRTLGAAGKLTSQVVFSALLSQADAVDARFKTAGITYAQAFTTISNAAKIAGKSFTNAFISDDSKGIPFYINQIGVALAEMASKIEIQMLQFKYNMYMAFKDIQAFLSEPIYIQFQITKTKIEEMLPSLSEVKGYASKVAGTLYSSFSNLFSVGPSDNAPGFATGGQISGPGSGTSDSIPAMLSNGEYVVRASSTSKYRSLLDAINNDNVMHFAEGTPTANKSGYTIPQRLSALFEKIREPIENFIGVLARFAKGILTMIPSLDRITATLKNLAATGPGPQAGQINRTIGHDTFNAVVPKVAQVPALLTLGAATASLVLLLTKQESTLRMLGLGVTALATERIINAYVKPSDVGGFKSNVVEATLAATKAVSSFFISPTPGTNIIGTKIGSVFGGKEDTSGRGFLSAIFDIGLFGDKGFGGVLASLTRIALMFAAGRAAIGGGLLSAAIAPTKFVNNLATSAQASYAERAFNRSDKSLKDLTEANQRQADTVKAAVSDLAKEKFNTGRIDPATNRPIMENIGARRAAEMARGGNVLYPAGSVFSASNQAFAAAARNATTAMEAHTAATKAQFTAGTENTTRLKASSEALRAQVNENTKAFRSGITNTSGALGGTFGTLIGFNLGRAISDSLGENTSNFAKIGITIGATFVTQAIGAGIGQAIAAAALFVFDQTIGRVMTFIVSRIALGITTALAVPMVTMLAIPALFVAAATAFYLLWTQTEWFSKQLKEWMELGKQWGRDFVNYVGERLFGRKNLVEIGTNKDKIDPVADKSAALAERLAEGGISKEEHNRLLLRKSEYDIEISALNQKNAALGGDSTYRNVDMRDPFIQGQVDQAINNTPAEVIAENLAMLEKFKNAINSFDAFMDGIAFRVLNAIGLTPGPQLTARVTGMQKKAVGGRISGPGTGTSDSIPAMLSNGEFVINAQASSRHADLLHSINSGASVEYFAKGGLATVDPAANKAEFFMNSKMATGQYKPESFINGTAGIAKLALMINEASVSGIKITESDAIALFRTALVENRRDYGSNGIKSMEGAGGFNGGTYIRPKYLDPLIEKFYGTKGLNKDGKSIESVNLVGNSYTKEDLEIIRDSLKDPFQVKEMLSSFTKESEVGRVKKFLRTFKESNYDLSLLEKEMSYKIKASTIRDESDPERMYLMHMLFKMKESNKKNISSLVDSGLWNGKGVVRDGYRTGRTNANSENHIAKTNSLDILENKPIFDYFKSMLQIRDRRDVRLPELKYATGGRISGPGTGTSDSIPAMLSNGEFVINAQASSKHADLLHSINNGASVGYFASGLTLPSTGAGGGRGAVNPNSVLPIEISVTELEKMPDIFQKLVIAIRGRESGGTKDPENVLSHKGALGSMQITKDTFDTYKKAGERFEVETDRVNAALRKLESDFKYYGGSVTKTIAAYHGGRGVVDGGKADGPGLINPRSNDKDAVGKNGVFTTEYVEQVLEKLKSKVGTSIDKTRQYAADLKPAAKTMMDDVKDMVLDAFRSMKAGLIKAGVPEALFDSMEKIFNNAIGMFADKPKPNVGKSFKEFAGNLSSATGGKYSEEYIKALPQKDRANLSELYLRLKEVTDKQAEIESDKAATILADKPYTPNEIQDVELEGAASELKKAIIAALTPSNLALDQISVKSNQIDFFEALKKDMSELTALVDSLDSTNVTLDKFKDIKQLVKLVKDWEEQAKGTKTDSYANMELKRSKNALSEQLRAMIKEPVEVVKKAGPTDLHKKSGADFTGKVQQSFSTGLTSLIKGDSNPGEMLKGITDTFTSGIIDNFVGGLTTNLFKTLGPSLSNLGAGVGKLGSDAADPVDAMFNNAVEEFKIAVDRLMNPDKYLNDKSIENNPNVEVGGPMRLGTVDSTESFEEDSKTRKKSNSMFDDPMGLLNKTKSFAKDPIGAGLGFMDSVASGKGDLGENITGAMEKSFPGLANTLSTGWKDMGGIMEGSFSDLGGILGGAFKGIAGMLGGGAGGGGNLFGNLFSMGMSYFGGTPVIPMQAGGGYADGGFIKGMGSSTSDSIPAMLSNGEFVINAKATKQNRRLIEAINSGRISKFAAGGIAGLSAITETMPKIENKSSSTGIFNINITGDISRQTRSEIMSMIPHIAGGVNNHNREIGYKQR